jgi:hypothetical protein
MSLAVICDKCGRIFDEDLFREQPFHAIWLDEPGLYVDGAREKAARVHLCNSCYGQFEGEYLANLKGWQ